MENRRQITSAPQALAFLLAGNATATIVSVKSGARFTFKVTAAKNARPGGRAPSHFVSLMTASDNEDGFSYLGLIRDGQFEHGRKSAITAEAPSARGFTWVFRALNSAATLPADVEFWHEGRCCVCARKLTVPSSIESGIGPECSKKHKKRHAVGTPQAAAFACEATP